MDYITTPNISQEKICKICKICKVSKPVDRYHRQKKGKFGVRSVCAECNNEHQKSNPKYIASRLAYRIKNKERNNAHELAKYHANKEFLSVRRKQFRDEFKSKYPELYQARQRKLWKRENELYKHDIQYRLRKRIRGRILSAIKKNCKTAPSLSLLGCSIKRFKSYLEAKMTQGMTWEKFIRGDIHLDHVKPCSLFDLSKDSEQRRCFHYSNTQPLWAVDNLKKSNKY